MLESESEMVYPAGICPTVVTIETSAKYQGMSCSRMVRDKRNPRSYIPTPYLLPKPKAKLRGSHLTGSASSA